MTTYPHRKVDGGKHRAKVCCGERETTHGEQVFHVIVGSPQEGETEIKNNNIQQKKKKLKQSKTMHKVNKQTKTNKETNY